MTELPTTLEDAIAQAQTATEAALADGYKRLQVELLFPELKSMPVAEQFLTIFEKYGSHIRIFFPDAGAAALAKREWGEVPFHITDIGSGKTGAKPKIYPEDEIFLFVAPTAIEVIPLEKLCEEIGDRPIVMLNPSLEDAGIVGIGYAARQIRERFIKTIESCYYLRPIFEEAAVFRCYPGLWEVWVRKGNDYQKITELPNRPSGDELDSILMQKQPQTPGESASVKKASMFRGLQRFLRALRS
ncbi:MAG: DUF1995 family protein [Rhizonema sp. PD37]|nr:DUF1995 family protein [Rhizonema sp. PD37]